MQECRCEGAERGRFSGLSYGLGRVMSGKAYIRHILSIYSAYIGDRRKAGGRKKWGIKVSKVFKDDKVFKGSKDNKVFKVLKVLRDYFYSESGGGTCVRRSLPLS